MSWMQALDWQSISEPFLTHFGIQPEKKAKLFPVFYWRGKITDTFVLDFIF